MKDTKAYQKSYDLEGWEGGMAVFVTSGDHGVKVVSIPRLRLSTALTGNGDEQQLMSMLMTNKTMYRNPNEMDFFANLIMRDIQNLRWTG